MSRVVRVALVFSFGLDYCRDSFPAHSSDD